MTYSFGRAFLRGSRRNRCRLCHGDGSIPRSVIRQLCEQMQQVANAMQAGDETRAAIEARKAARLAGRLMARAVVMCKVTTTCI